MVILVLLGIVLVELTLIGIAVNDARLKEKYYRNPPNLDTADDVLNYLEAASIGQKQVEPLIGEFKKYLNKVNMPKQLPAKQIKPIWHHSTKEDTPPEVHWEIFLKDLIRETIAENKMDVIKHWIIDMENRFTLTERDLILEQFTNGEDRQKVRAIFAEQKNRALPKPPPTREPSAGV